MSAYVGSATLEIQRAVLRVLRSDAILAAAVAGIFDYVSPNQAYPYVVFGETTEVEENTMLRRGREVTFTLHVWSRKLGFSEVYSITDLVVNALEDTELVPMDGWEWVYTIYDNFHTVNDPDGISRHGILRFRCRVSRAS